jgi:hypothetical protein
MRRIKNFSLFIKEAQQISLSDPSKDGEIFAGVLASQKDAKEQPKGSNKGPEVTKYLQSVGLSSGLPWCMAFVYYVFDDVCKRLSKSNTVVKTGGCMNHWEQAPADAKIPVDQIKSTNNESSSQISSQEGASSTVNQCEKQESSTDAKPVENFKYEPNVMSLSEMFTKMSIKEINLIYKKTNKNYERSIDELLIIKDGSIVNDSSDEDTLIKLELNEEEKKALKEKTVQK